MTKGVPKNLKARVYEPTETKDFAGMIMQAGTKKRLTLNAPDWWQHELNKFQVGTRVSLYLSSFKPKRTLRQNRYLWAYYNMIARETDNTPEEIHIWAKGSFLSRGVKEVFGSKIRIGKSTTSLSKQDFSDYLEKICAATGVELPPVANYDL